MAAKKASKQSRVDSATIAALNVAAHPYDDPSIYEKLFRKCVTETITVKYHGKQAAALAQFRKRGDYHFGTLVAFILLDSTDAWGNPRTGEEATEEELKHIRLPSNLHPDFKRHDFVLSQSRDRGGPLEG